MGTNLKRIDQALLVKHFGLSRSAVSQWFAEGGQVPAERCPDVEMLTGVPCEELRPDVNWEVLRNTSKVHG